MGVKGFALTMGLGMAAGAVGIMMMPKQCKARQLANEAATKVEDVVNQVSSSISSSI